MIYDYPAAPHSRRHGPTGYTLPESYKPWLRDEFTFRCVYCLTRERWARGGQAAFSVEHIIPRSADPSRTNDYNNLIYACTDCNSIRQDQPVLNPCVAAFADHLRIHEDGMIEALTPEGRAHIKVLRLDSPALTEFRERIIQTVRGLEEETADSPPNMLLRWVGFPDDLPDLAALRPPGGNCQPAAVRDCWYGRRKQGTLPGRY